MKLIALDLEMNMPSRKIIEIGIVIGDTDSEQILEEKNWLIKIDEPITEFITDLTSINDKMLEENGIHLADAYRELMECIKNHSPFINPLVWGGGDVDHLIKQVSVLEQWPFIAAEHGEHPFGRRIIDAKTLFVSWRIANGDMPNGGLAKSLTKFGLAFKGKKHRAMDDARNTFIIYCEMLKMLRIK